VEADKNHIAIRISKRSTIVVGRIRIIVSRHHDAKSFTLEGRPCSACKQQRQIFFYHAAWSARSIVHAAMRRVEYDYNSRVRRRWWSDLLRARLWWPALLCTRRRLLNLLR
jgi:hypothetical protein